MLRPAAPCRIKRPSHGRTQQGTPGRPGLRHARPPPPVPGRLDPTWPRALAPPPGSPSLGSAAAPKPRHPADTAHPTPADCLPSACCRQVTGCPQRRRTVSETGARTSAQGRVEGPGRDQGTGDQWPRGLRGTSRPGARSRPGSRPGPAPGGRAFSFQGRAGMSHRTSQLRFAGAQASDVPAPQVSALLRRCSRTIKITLNGKFRS